MMTTGQDIFCLKLPHSLTSQFKYKWLAPRKEILGYQVTSRFTCQVFFSGFIATQFYFTC